MIVNDDRQAADTGETQETIREHKNAIKKELAKQKNRNHAYIKELMEITFGERRKSIISSPTTLDIVLEEYPALKLVTEV